jgi:hypothetical protein
MNGDPGKGFLLNPWPILMVALLGQSARLADPERARFVA